MLPCSVEKAIASKPGRDRTKQQHSGRKRGIDGRTKSGWLGVLYRAAVLCIPAVVGSLTLVRVRPAVGQQVVYVNRKRQGGNTGSSWVDAYTDLQVALAHTSEGEIWIAQGTYTPAPPNGDRGATFRIPSGVAIYGGFRGDETSRDQRHPDMYPTILSGDLNGDDLPNYGNSEDNSYRVVTVLNALRAHCWTA